MGLEDVTEDHIHWASMSSIPTHPVHHQKAVEAGALELCHTVSAVRPMADRVMHILRNIPFTFLPQPSPRLAILGFLVVCLSYCCIFDMPLLSSKLPPYTGPYGVGTIDIEVPAKKPRTIGNAVLKDSGRPAFQVRELSCAYSLD